MQSFEIASKTGWLHRVGEAPGALVWLLTGAADEQAVAEMERILLPEIHSGRIPPCTLAGYGPVEWFEDYAPWPLTTPDGKVMSREGRLEATLDFAQKVFLPEAEKQAGCNGVRYAVGYSLGGLAALYAGCHMAGLAGVGSCSGSLWYPGFVDHAKENPPPCPVFLSLGGKEKNAKDPLMAQVETCTRQVFAFLHSRGETVFVHEPGGHFKDTSQRIARAVVWLLQSRKL